MLGLEEKKPQTSTALIKSFFTFATLFIALVLLIIRYDFSNVNVNALSFILAIVVIVLISKSVYEVTAGAENIKKMAEELANEFVKSSEQLFLEVYNNSPVAYLIVGQYGDIQSANTAAARLFGHPTDKLVKRDIFSFLETSNEEHQLLLKQKFQQGIVISEEEVKVTRENGISWTTVSVFQFSTTEGKRLSLVTFVDVTKQKEIEIAKTEFVSLASHQLRTPISGMRWSAELLLMDGGETLNVQQKRYLDRLLSSIKKMNRLVDDFLQVSRFELGTRILKIEQVTLEDLFEDIISEQTEMASSKKLEIHKQYDNSIGVINTDLGLLRIIITNLYSNAIKYTRVGGRISLSYQRLGDDLMLEVRDNGMGIPLSEQHRIFSKIFRASNAQKEVPDGTGLGLYILQKSVQTLLGRVNFESSENGTTFTVVIPLNL